VDAVTALEIFGGAARWTRLRQYEVSEHALHKAVASARVLSVGDGGYVLPGADPALVAAMELGGVVSHASAARLHGLDLWRPIDGIDVTVRRGSRPHRAGIRVHRINLRPDEIDYRLPATNILRTVLDCGRVLPLSDAVVILDSALRRCWVKPAELRAAADAARGHGSAALRRAVAHADALSGSALESALRPLLVLLDATLETQVRIRGVPGGPVDFVLNGWLVVETDGYEFHRERADYRKDREKSNALAVRGYTLLRFTYEDVKGRPWWVLAQVQAVLDRGPAARDPR
jgi:very-short-patch-repair endonuclease